MADALGCGLSGYPVQGCEMPFFNNFLKWAQYAPLVLEAFRAVAPKEAGHEADDSSRTALAELRKDVIERIAELEDELVRTKARTRELESMLATLQLWVWIGTGGLGLLTIIALIFAILALVHH